ACHRPVSDSRNRRDARAGRVSCFLPVWAQSYMFPGRSTRFRSGLPDRRANAGVAPDGIGRPAADLKFAELAFDGGAFSGCSAPDVQVKNRTCVPRTNTKQQKAAAENRGGFLMFDHRDEEKSVFCRPGSDLLFQALRLSTIGAGE